MNLTECLPREPNSVHFFRQDNADVRLTPFRIKLDWPQMTRLRNVEEKIKYTQETEYFIRNYSLNPDEVNATLEELGTEPISQKVKMLSVLLKTSSRY